MNQKRTEIRAMIEAARTFAHEAADHYNGMEETDYSDFITNETSFIGYSAGLDKIKERIAERFKNRHENVDEIINKALEGEG